MSSEDEWTGKYSALECSDRSAKQPFKNSEKCFGISATYIPYKLKIINFECLSSDFRMLFKQYIR